MSRKTDRASRALQQAIGSAILERLSDPRIDPAKVSVTRVEVADDMTRAKVFFSAIGDAAEQRTVQRALQSAAGRIQTLMMERVRMRATPVLRFLPDTQFKKSLTTLALIQQAMEELEQDERGRETDEVSADAPGDGDGDGADGLPHGVDVKRNELDEE